MKMNGVDDLGDESSSCGQVKDGLLSQLREVVNDLMTKGEYRSASFWCDKVVSLSHEDIEDIYKQAQCFYHLKEYHRAAHCIRRHNIHKSHTPSKHLLAKCHYGAKEYKQALDVLMEENQEKSMETEVNYKCADRKWKSSLALLKGKIHEALDNRSVAQECFKEALVYDIYSYEAFYSLIQHHMLTANEEETLLKSLPFDKLSDDEKVLLKLLYEAQLKKYAKPGNLPLPTEFNGRLQDNVDILTAAAERHYYNCDYHKCFKITSEVLTKDLYHMQCLPIHLSCLMELNKTNALFELAHKLVDLYPESPIAWYAVGCYYLKINKTDSARRFLSKATSLDNVFGPAWLLYGHSFAIESEHDQAMAAYFKASHLMKGCHLPLLYIGLEYGLTDNTKLAEKFFTQALVIAPDDPFVLHELGVIAYQTKDYQAAEKHFSDALKLLQSKSDMTCLPEKWEPLFNNLGHCLRKLKRYEEALEYHKQALVLFPQNPSSFSAIGYVYSLMCRWSEAVEYFHKALGLKRDDPFSSTMLTHAIEQLLHEITPLKEESPPYELSGGSEKISSKKFFKKFMSTSQNVAEESTNNISTVNESLNDSSSADIEMEISNE